MIAEATFRNSLLGLTSSYGKALTTENEPILHQHFLDAAADEGNILPHNTNLGKVAHGATYIGSTLVTTQVVMLNESFGMMPGYGEGLGELCGSVEIECNTLGEASASPLPIGDKLWLVASLYSHGPVVISILDVNEQRTTEAQLVTDLELRPFLKPRAHTFSRLDYNNNHMLQANQLNKLQTFVTDSFVSTGWQ